MLLARVNVEKCHKNGYNVIEYGRSENVENSMLDSQPSTSSSIVCILVHRTVIGWQMYWGKYSILLYGNEIMKVLTFLKIIFSKKWSDGLFNSRNTILAKMYPSLN